MVYLLRKWSEGNIYRNKDWRNNVTEDMTVVNEAESKKETPEEIMQTELLTIDWAALKDYIWRTFIDNPESKRTKSNIKLLKNVIAKEENFAQVKANLCAASIYFDSVDYHTLFLGLTTFVVSLSGDLIIRLLGNISLITETIADIIGLGFTLVMWVGVGIRISKRFAESKVGMQNIKYLESLIDTFIQGDGN